MIQNAFTQRVVFDQYCELREKFFKARLELQQGRLSQAAHDRAYYRLQWLEKSISEWFGANILAQMEEACKLAHTLQHDLRTAMPEMQPEIEKTHNERPLTTV